MEAQADQYAVRLGYGSYLRDALVRMSAESLDNIYLSYIGKLLNMSHPSVHERLDAIDKELEANTYKEPLEAIPLQFLEAVTGQDFTGHILMKRTEKAVFAKYLKNRSPV